MLTLDECFDSLESNLKGCADPVGYKQVWYSSNRVSYSYFPGALQLPPGKFLKDGKPERYFDLTRLVPTRRKFDWDYFNRYLEPVSGGVVFDGGGRFSSLIKGNLRLKFFDRIPTNLEWLAGQVSRLLKTTDSEVVMNGIVLWCMAREMSPKQTAVLGLGGELFDPSRDRFDRLRYLQTRPRYERIFDHLNIKWHFPLLQPRLVVFLLNHLVLPRFKGEHKPIRTHKLDVLARKIISRTIKRRYSSDPGSLYNRMRSSSVTSVRRFSAPAKSSIVSLN